MVEFTTNEIPVWTDVNISGMKNKATVDFSANSITPTGKTGNIALHAKSNESRWAILLPQDPVTATATANEYNSTGSVSVPAIKKDAYLTGESGVNFSMTSDGTFNAYTTPLTLEAMTENTEVSFTTIGSIGSSLSNIEYSKNGGAWTEYTFGEAVSLENIGDRVSFRGTNATYAISESDYCFIRWSYPKQCYVYGNIMSLINKDNYPTNTTLTGTYTFYHMFFQYIYSHPTKDLVLPATTLTDYCFGALFVFLGEGVDFWSAFFKTKVPKEKFRIFAP